MCGNSISTHIILKLVSQFQLKLKARLLNPFPLLTSGTGPCSGISARFCLSKPSAFGSVLPLRPSSRAVGGTSSLGCTLEDGVLMPRIPKNSRCCCGFRPYKTAFYATPCGRILVFERIGNVKCPCNNIFEPNSPTSNGNFPQINSAWHWSHSMSQSNMTQNNPQTTSVVLVASVELGDNFGLHIMSCFLHGGWWNVGHIKQTRKNLPVDLGVLSINFHHFIVFLHPPRSWKNCFAWNCLPLDFSFPNVKLWRSMCLSQPSHQQPRCSSMPGSVHLKRLFEGNMSSTNWTTQKYGPSLRPMILLQKLSGLIISISDIIPFLVACPCAQSRCKLGNIGTPSEICIIVVLCVHANHAPKENRIIKFYKNCQSILTCLPPWTPKNWMNIPWSSLGPPWKQQKHLENVVS